MKKLLFCCLMFLTGCSLFVANPEVVIKDVNVIGLDASGVAIEFYLSVTNPNSYDLKLLGYNYDLKIMAVPLSRGGARDLVDFPGRSTTDVRLPVRIAYHDMVEILKRRPDPNHIPYQLKAGFDLDTPVGALAVPFEKSGTYAIPESYRPSFYLKQITDLLGEFEK